MSSHIIRNILLAILAIVILVGIFIFYKPLNDVFNHGNGIGISTSTPITATSTIAITYTTKEIDDSSVPLNYSVKATYPQFSGIKNYQIQYAMNLDIQTFIKKEVASYEASLNDNSSIPSPSGDSSDQNTLVITFNVSQNTSLSNIIPIQFVESYYISGAAHPGHDIVTLNYNETTGQQISLDSLFTSNSNYLQALSDYSINALKAKLGTDAEDDMIQEGAGPSSDNFGSFLITDQGLVILFNEYQVAAYAAGPQQITIPYSALSSIINPESPVGGEINK